MNGRICYSMSTFLKPRSQTIKHVLSLPTTNHLSLSCRCLRPCQQSWCGLYTQLAGVTIVFRSLVIDWTYLVWVPPSPFAVLCLLWKFMRSAAPTWGSWIEFPGPKTTPNDTQGCNLVPPDRQAGVEETPDAPDVDLVGELYQTCDFASPTNSWSKIYGVRTQWLTNPDWIWRILLWRIFNEQSRIPPQMKLQV